MNKRTRKVKIMRIKINILIRIALLAILHTILYNIGCADKKESYSENASAYDKWQNDTIEAINNTEVQIIKDKQYLALSRRYSSTSFTDSIAKHIFEEVSPYIDIPQDHTIEYRLVNFFVPSQIESEIYAEYMELKDIKIKSPSIIIECVIVRGRLNSFSIMTKYTNKITKEHYEIIEGTKRLIECVEVINRPCNH